MTDDFAQRVSGVAALAEPARRALYLYVAARGEPVSREQAAEGTGLPLHTAKFHLDRLVGEGLLEVEFRRLSGRSGPGAGRPAKLYRRSDRQLSVSVPERRYDLAGDVLAAAFDLASREGVGLDESVRRAAAARGQAMAASGARPPAGSISAQIRRACEALARYGYEPRAAQREVTLANCPFHSLAREHTELVCGMNQGLIAGVLDGLGCRRLQAELDPAADRCCVVVRARRSADQ